MRDRPTGARLLLLLVAGAAAGAFAGRAAEPEAFPFAVLNQRSIALTAEYWNPILDYLRRRSGVPLRLVMGKTASETTRMAVRGEAAFVYTNHLFTPERSRLGFRVLARPDNAGIQGVVAVRAASSVRTLADLGGRAVAFPSRDAFVAYWVAMDALLRAKVAVRPVFAGNQEGALAQLASGSVDAASVNSAIVRDYVRRERLDVRLIWSSEVFPDLCVMAAPSVPESAGAAVRRVLVEMSGTGEGRAVLAAGAARLGMAAPQGFVESNDGEYESYRRFFARTLVKE